LDGRVGYPGTGRGFLLSAFLWMLFSCTSSQTPVSIEDFEYETPGGAIGEARSGDTTVPGTVVPFPLDYGELPQSRFDEIWAYLISDEEAALGEGFPISDIGYFGAEVDSYGQLSGLPNIRRIASFKGRKHLVVACNSRGLTHFVLEPGSKSRRELVADLLEAARPYDGLQIDFEMVPQRDGDNFRSFLRELREGLGRKTFTVALPARTKIRQDDVYDYRKILPLVDRVLVMAYDEHWSGSAPGPIASIDWCREVAAYALDVIGREKLIMGIPFYGRTWGDVNPSRAFFHSGIQRLRRENDVTAITRENSIPTFSYQIPLTVTVYYEDEFSLSARFELYRKLGVRSVGFWRLGQESPGVWDILDLGEF
jgi:spore germination protein YaaH